jgi:hypothetical protein
MVDLTVPINEIAIVVGLSIAGVVAIVIGLKGRGGNKAVRTAGYPSGPEQTSTGARPTKSLRRPTPEIVVVSDVKRDIPDSWRSFLWFWIAIGTIISAPIGLYVSHVNLIVSIAYFGTFPLLAVIAGYAFSHFRVAGPARDFDKILKQNNCVALHIGTDDKARLVGGRRGSTGRWHLPNMEITADAIKKAIFPFYGNVISIIHSVSDAQLNPEFLYFATVYNRNSELIGEDHRPKLSTDIADTISKMVEREEELLEMENEMVRINRGETTLANVIEERYRDIIYDKDGKLITDVHDKLTEYWGGMMKDDGFPMKIELGEISRAFEITIQEKGYHVEFEKDMRGKLIGAHLVHDRVLDAHDFRNYLPTGGTAESSHLLSENARLAGNEERGQTDNRLFRLMLYILLPVGIGVMLYLIFLGIKQL